MSSEKARHVGTIAHIDHGKTSLAAAITRVLQQKEAAPPMSSDVKIPDAVMIEAERVNDEIFRIAHDEVHILNHTQRKEAIANALLAAEQRGIERAAEECDRFADQFPTYPEFDEPHNVGRHLAAAIRSLGEKI